MKNLGLICILIFVSIATVSANPGLKCQITNSHLLKQNDHVVAKSSMRHSLKLSEDIPKNAFTFGYPSFDFKKSIKGISEKDLPSLFKGLIFPEAILESKVLLEAPTKGILGLNKKGNWKSGALSAYKLTAGEEKKSASKDTTTSSDSLKIKSIIKIFPATKSSSHSEGRNHTFYSPLVKKEINLILVTTVGFDCTPPRKNSGKKSISVNDSDRTIVPEKDDSNSSSEKINSATEQ